MSQDHHHPTNSTESELLVETKTLADKFFQSKLSEVDEKRLVEILSNSVAAQQAYVVYMHDICYLTYLARGQMLNMRVDDLIQPQLSSKLNSITSLGQKTVNFFMQPTPLSITIAFLFIISLLGGLAQLYLTKDVPPTKEIVEKITLENGQIIKFAKMIRTTDVVWDEGTDGYKPNHQFKANEIIRIQAGLVEVGFGDGSVVLIEGPAEYEVISSNSSFLSTGKLTAKAKLGFMVITPIVKVLDLGTIFGISVSKNRETLISVLDGKVRVLGRSSNTSFRPFDLATNHSAILKPGRDHPELSRGGPLSSKEFTQGKSHFIGDIQELNFENAEGHLATVPEYHYPNLKFINCVWIKVSKLRLKFSEAGFALGALQGTVSKKSQNPWAHPTASNPVVIEFKKPVKWVSIDAYGSGINSTQISAFNSKGKRVGFTQGKKIKNKNLVETLIVSGDDIVRVEFIQPFYNEKTGTGGGVVWDNLRYVTK